MNRESKLARIALACAMSGVVASAGAAVVSVGTTWNVNQAFSFPALNAAVSIANGDHVVYTVDFLGSQKLTLGAGGGLWTALSAGDNDSTFTIQNITLDLLGFSGTGGAAASYSKPSESGGMAHLGPSWFSLIGAGQTATFDGFKVEFDVQSIDVSPHRYENAFLQHINGTVGQAPEPMSLASVGVALAAAGLARRRTQPAR